MQQSARFGIEHYSQLKELCNKKWDYHNAFFFTGTLATTIGYGNLVPKTDNGRIFCLCFCLIGESHMQGPPNTERWVFALQLPNSPAEPNSPNRPNSLNGPNSEQIEQLEQSGQRTDRTARFVRKFRTVSTLNSAYYPNSSNSPNKPNSSF